MAKKSSIELSEPLLVKGLGLRRLRPNESHLEKLFNIEGLGRLDDT